MEEKSFADEILGGVNYEPEKPRGRRNFLPWHKPRKQYVRQSQWLKEIDRMVSSNKPSEDVLKYLGLPGSDLIDLRYFHNEVCKKHDLSLRFLGFNTAARPNSKDGAELNVSLDEVKKLHRVDPRSKIIGDDFALLANDRSMAFKEACNLGPYDVINLDLCDGFGAQAPSSLGDDYYKAVHRLFSLQARSMNPWLFFLTTRADRSNIDEKVLSLLLEKYLKNLDECEDFRQKSCELFSIEDEKSSQVAIQNPDGVLNIFLTGLCKWLIGLALELRPPMKVEVKSFIGYRVVQSSQCEDLVSMAIKFTPTLDPSDDPVGLTNIAVSDEKECGFAIGALTKVSKRLDADYKLESNKEIYQKMLESSVHLIEQARYDTQEYREWALQDTK